MKLNHDCVREVLLYIEENKVPDYYLESEQLDEDINNFNFEVINYTIKQLSNAGFIEAKSIMGTSSYLIGDLTWEGHKFIDTIRDDSVWKETKERASKVSSVSLPIIQQLALSVSKQKFGLE